MKNTLLISLIVVLLLGFTTAFGQKRIENLPNKDKGMWNFGYYIGLIQTEYVVEYKESIYPETEVVINGGVGFKIGVVGEMRINKNLSLQFEPGLSSNVKTLYFNNNTLLTERDSVREVPSTYLHLPLLLKFSANRLNNIRPFVIGGVSYDYNFSANEENPDDNLAGEFRLKRHNFMYEIGIGMDFYLSYFKFSPSIVGVFSMNNELIPDNIDSTSPYTGPIESLATRGVFLKLVFD